MNTRSASVFTLWVLLGITMLNGCTSTPQAQPIAATDATPPPAIQDWMNRLTVEHYYDSETGFIVADEVIDLPSMLAEGQRIDEALKTAESTGQTVVVFATADRCAPCQQFKKDAINDFRVIARLSSASIIAMHVEVDDEPELAQQYLGSLGIPVTYAFRDGELIARLPGQRSAADLVDWLDGLDATD